MSAFGTRAETCLASQLPRSSPNRRRSPVKLMALFSPLLRLVMQTCYGELRHCGWNGSGSGAHPLEDGMLTGRRASPLHPAQEVPDVGVRLVRQLELRNVPAVGEDHGLRVRQRLRDVPGEAVRHQAVAATPDEQRRGLQAGKAVPEALLAEGFVEVDRAQRAEERHPAGPTPPDPY